MTAARGLGRDMKRGARACDAQAPLPVSDYLVKPMLM
jgi:hypothetical protein